jgi:farnesyl-diphosphate farnesyltransferase
MRAGDLNDLLQRTSRTFAIAIPLLPEPLREEVATAYLLFRIADTFEDATMWTRQERLSALREWEMALDSAEPEMDTGMVTRWLAKPPCEHAGYLELLGCAPNVLASLARMGRKSRAIVAAHTLRTVDGMAGFVARSADDGELRLRDFEDLRAYCYVVAGIVGELLTALFLNESPALESVRPTLERHSASFAEGLQLVNILKDSADDERAGRRYLPPTVRRGEVFEWARRDLDSAVAYVLAMQAAAAPRGVVAFAALPVLLAGETLDLTRREGPGAKLGRDRVGQLLVKMNDALEAGEPAL